MKQLIAAISMAAMVLFANSVMANTNTQEITKATAEAATKLRLNDASLEQLTAVPGLGKVKAQAVIDHIAQHGAINSQAELTKVKGIGEKLAARVAQYVSFD